MKIITASPVDETCRRAWMIAAERDTLGSALVEQFLVDLARNKGENEKLEREERALRERTTTFRAFDRLSREDAHRRGC
jgi:hypothetical protein